MTEELLAGAVTKLRDAIRPLAYETPHWDGTRALWADPLYTRMRVALTATTATTGARLQASKAPARIDVMAWFCDVDTTTCRWIRGGDTIVEKLERLHDYAWTPEHLKLVKAVTRRCDAWTETAKQLLQDNPPVIPLRRPCPRCNEFWVHTGVGESRTRTFALRVSEHGAQCHACKARWITNQEIGVFIKMLG
jgi:hypothetical protein